MRLDIAHGDAEAIAAAVAHWLDVSSQSGAFEAAISGFLFSLVRCSLGHMKA